MIKKLVQQIKGDKKIVVSNYASLLVLQSANYILPLLILPYLVRVLGAEKFGLVMFAQSLATFLAVFVDFGFNISGTREISLARNNKQKLSEIFSAIMIIKLVLIIIAYIILCTLIQLFTRFQIDSKVYYLSFGVVVGQALFPVWFFQGIEKMKFITFINIIAKTIFTALVFLLITKQSDYLQVPLYNSLGFIIAGVLGFIMTLKYIKLTIPSRNLIKQLISESSSLFVSNFAVSLYTSSNVFILGLFTGNTITGIYSSMEKLVLAIKNIYAPLYQALFPWLAKQKTIKKIKTIQQLTPAILIISSLITIFILLFGKQVLSFIYDDELITKHAIIFKILSFISIFSALNMLYNSLYFPAAKKYKTRMFILISGGILNLITSLIFVRIYGIYATAYCVISTELFLLLMGYFYFKKEVKA